MRYAARIDTNQSFIVGGLRALGVGVEPGMSRLGKGRADLLVAVHKNRTFVREIKRTVEQAKKEKRSVKEVALNDDQKKWHAAWPGDVAVWRTLDDAIADCFPGGLDDDQKRALSRYYDTAARSGS